MTIGDKIRYYRVKQKMTQDRLAELTGIHPVSIRKYETNKMQPQAPQIFRLAEALNINFMALYGLDYSGVRMKTVGDLYCLLLLLCTAGFIQIKGPRGKESKIQNDTAVFSLHPALAPFLTIASFPNMVQSDLTNQALVFRDDVKAELLAWEKMEHKYRLAMDKANEFPDDEELWNEMEKCLAQKEQKEMDLQDIQEWLPGMEE